MNHTSFLEIVHLMHLNLSLKIRLTYMRLDTPFQKDQG